MNAMPQGEELIAWQDVTIAGGTASIDDIDMAMKGACGFPMGPFELLDLVGLDTSLSILEALHREFGDPGMVPHPALRRLVAAGHLGRKTGRGFRTHS